MKSPLALLLVALVSATACTDSLTSPSDLKANAATTASNPPPPPVTGELSGLFTIPVAEEAALQGAMSSLRLDVAAVATTSLHYTFRQQAIYDKNLVTGISSITMRNRLAIWVSDAGASIGHGVISEKDEAGNLWSLDLNQIHSSTGGQLLTCESATEHNQFCVQVAQPIVASVRLFHGLDESGNPVYDVPLQSSASTIAFRWTWVSN